MTKAEYTRLLTYLREIKTVTGHIKSETDDPAINILAGGIEYDLEQIKERAGEITD